MNSFQVVKHNKIIYSGQNVRFCVYGQKGRVYGKAEYVSADDIWKIYTGHSWVDCHLNNKLANRLATES